MLFNGWNGEKNAHHQMGENEAKSREKKMLCARDELPAGISNQHWRPIKSLWHEGVHRPLNRFSTFCCIVPLGHSNILKCVANAAPLPLMTAYFRASSLFIACTTLFVFGQQQTFCTSARLPSNIDWAQRSAHKCWHCYRIIIHIFSDTLSTAVVITITAIIWAQWNRE